MKKVKLSEVCDISSGGTPSRSRPEYFKGDIPWAKISDIENASVNGGVLYETEECISIDGLKSIRGKLFPKGTLLFSMYGSIGKVCISGIELSTNQAILGIRPQKNNEISLDYLKIWFASNKQKLIKQGRGAALKNLSATIIRNLEIELPSYEEQLCIAHLLGKVEGLIFRRKQHLQQLDDLLKSVFTNKFGPLSDGYDDWPIVEIKDLTVKHKGAMRTGPFGSNLLHSEFSSEGDVAVLGIDNAVQNRFEWGEKRYISYKKYKELENYRIFPEDVIVTIMGTIGRSAVVPNDIPLAINTKHLAAITLNKELANPTFLSYSLHSSPFILSQFKRKNRGAIMSGLNLGLIREIKLKQPPIGLQNEFAETYANIEKLKTKYWRSLIELENLFEVLGKQAIRREVDLSRITIPFQSNASNFMNDQAVIKLEDTARIPPTIYLPNPNGLLISFENFEARKTLIKEWLEAYCEQLTHIPFSVQNFMALAQVRLAELYPDKGFELGIDDYEYTKVCIFEALTIGKLQQVLNDTSNSIELRVAQI